MWEEGGGWLGAAEEVGEMGAVGRWGDGRPDGPHLVNDMSLPITSPVRLWLPTTLSLSRLSPSSPLETPHLLPSCHLPPFPLHLPFTLFIFSPSSSSPAFPIFLSHISPFSSFCVFSTRPHDLPPPPVVHFSRPFLIFFTFFHLLPFHFLLQPFPIISLT